ncbi:MAG: hypothetical protein ACO27L_02120 [Schleiferiaceae bacterium]
MNFLLPSFWKRPAQLVFFASLAMAILWISVGAPEGGIVWFKTQVPALWSDEVLGDQAGPGWIANNLTDELFLTLITLSGLAAGFSREPVEDELISLLRWKALAQSVLLNAVILIAATWTLYGVTFLYVLYAQLVALLVFYNLRLMWTLRQHYTAKYEE